VGELEHGLAARFPAGFLALALLPTTAGLTLPAEVRREAERVAANRSSAAKAIAHVIEGTGFVAATVRSISIGMSMLARTHAPHRIFGGVEPATAWLATFLDRDKQLHGARLLSEAIETARAS
jgi:hypothetical protein